MAFQDPMSHRHHLHSQSLCQGCVGLTQPFETVYGVEKVAAAVNRRQLIESAYSTLRTVPDRGEYIKNERNRTATLFLRRERTSP